MTRTYLYILLRRAGGFWIGVRLMYFFLSSLMLMVQDARSMAVESSLQMRPGGALIAIASVTALVLIDARVVGEDVLVGNLGVSRSKTALVVLILVTLLEVAAALFFKLRAS